MLYDLAIIGGGPAGYSAALEAASLGLKVIIFEENLFGGTCLNRGCVPTKFLAHVADLYTQIKNADQYGVSVDNSVLDYAKSIQKKRLVVSELRDGLERLINQKEIDIIYKHAKIMKEGVIQAADNQYNTKNILIASGSVCAQSFVAGALSSDEILELDYIPKTMKIIGGGVVAVEFAHIFSELGTRVSMYIRGERLLRKWDKDLAMGVTQNLKRKGVTIYKKCSLEQMQEKDDSDIIFFAAGRDVMTDDLYVEGIDIAIDNGIITDEIGRTNISGIFAAGDVVSGSCQLAHVAMEQGRRVARFIAGQELGKESAVVNCIYVHPEIASVGLFEAEAKEKGHNVISGKQVMMANARTLIGGGERGFIKLVADADSLELLGAQLMCERASDIVSELALAINNRMSIYDIVYSVRPHPSFCEAVTEAAAVLLEKKNEV